MKEEREEVRFVNKEVKGAKKERLQSAEGQCECCRKDGLVFLTDDGDFCEVCVAKMTWLR